jgi:hypothetical protein
MNVAKIIVPLVMGMAAATAVAQTRLNELYVNPPGTDDSREYVEIRGTPGTSLANLWVVEINGHTTSEGALDVAQDLSTVTLGTNGLLMIGNFYGSFGTPFNAPVQEGTVLMDWNPSIGTANLVQLPNNSSTILIVSNFTGFAFTNLDNNHDGILDVTPWSSIVDSVGWQSTTNSSDHLFTAAVLFNGTGNTPDAAVRFPTNYAANDSAAWYAGNITTSVFDQVGVYFSASTNSSTANFPAGAALTPGAPNFPQAHWPPLLTVNPAGWSQKGVIGSNLTFTITASQVSYDSTQRTSLVAANLPQGASFASVTGAAPVVGTFSWTPTNFANVDITFTAADTDGTNAQLMNVSIGFANSSSNAIQYSVIGSVYTQTFDSLPYPTNGVSVNSANPVTINDTTYSLSNPYDFAVPASAGSAAGLGITNMSGWYGMSDGGTARFGATFGDQTTGGQLSFGLPNSTNRALGLLDTSSTIITACGVKFVNRTSNTLSYINVNCIGELWRSGTIKKTMPCNYYIDLTGQAPFSDTSITAPLHALDVDFALRPGDPSAATNYDGTAAANQTNLQVAGQAIANWPPNAALWIFWEMTDATGKGQGYGIDNFTFSASNAPAGSSVANVSFSTSGVPAKLESAGTVAVSVQLSSATTGSVQISSAGTATNVTRFTLSATNFNFTAASSTQTLTVTLVDDQLIQPAQVISLNLTNAVGVSLGTVTNFSFSILDNDDSNTNGMLDTWELANFGTLTNATTADTDGDGFNNYSEYIAGTQPTNVFSFPRVQNIAVASPPMLGFQAVSGRVYEIEFSGSMTNSTWTGLGPTNVTASGLVAITDLAVTNGRFYRLRIKLP